MKAAKATSKKVHKTSAIKMEIDKKTNSSSISDGETDHKAASRENKIKGMGHFIPITIRKKRVLFTKVNYISLTNNWFSLFNWFKV